MMMFQMFIAGAGEGEGEEVGCWVHGQIDLLGISMKAVPGWLSHLSLSLSRSPFPCIDNFEFQNSNSAQNTFL